jgi:signal transduction histidine kinase
MDEFRRSDFTTPVRLKPGRNASSGDEIDLLETVFSEMSARIGDLIKELKDKDRLRRELVSNISHDLRTPLASLRGYLETLDSRSTRLSESEKQEILEKAVRLISRLGKLVAELLELARLDSLDITAEKEPFPLADLVNDILMDYREIARRKSIDLTADIKVSKTLVYGDIRLLERAVQNIIDNAIKFTQEKGHVTVTLLTDESKVRLTVSDTGPGIEPEAIDHIFERFYRAESSSKETGVGLGLAIAQRIADLHGTEIKARNLQEGGAAFTLDLDKYPPVPE